MSILFIKMGLSAFLASLGFGLLFNIKGKNLFLAGLVGGVGGVCYKISLYYGTLLGLLPYPFFLKFLPVSAKVQSLPFWFVG